MIKEADIRYNKYIKRMLEIGGFLIMPIGWVGALLILLPIALLLAYGIIQHFSIPMIIALLVGCWWPVFFYLYGFLALGYIVWHTLPKGRRRDSKREGRYAWIANAVKFTSMIVVACIICLPVVYGMSFIDYKWKVNISEKNIIRVYVGDEKVYEGKRAFTNIVKHGVIKPNKEVAYSIAKVTIYKKLFPYSAIDKTYVDKNIKVEPGPPFFK